MALLRLAASLSILLIGCESPPPTSDGGLPDGSAVLDAGPIDPPMCVGIARMPITLLCEPMPTDYSPGADDLWGPCISDDGEYHRVRMDISSIARVAAFEELSALLFDPTRDPTPGELLEGRLIYQRDEGIDSRVVRRFDPHYSVPAGTDCTLDGSPETFPDYCVGPARLGPLILSSFAAAIEGGRGEPTRVHAARIEAAIAWFLYVSTFKESLTCTTTAKDCDSSYAYYTGGEPARGGLGLARMVERVDPAAHDRAWDGLLAVRCWRDLDPAEVASDLALRDRARLQYDRAMLDGMSAILRDRAVQACDSEGAELLYHWAFARVIGGFLDRAVRERDPAAADALAAELAHERPGPADATRIVEILDAVFDCP